MSYSEHISWINNSPECLAAFQLDPSLRVFLLAPGAEDAWKGMAEDRVELDQADYEHPNIFARAVTLHQIKFYEEGSDAVVACCRSIPAFAGFVVESSVIYHMDTVAEKLKHLRNILTDLFLRGAHL